MSGDSLQRLIAAANRNEDLSDAFYYFSKGDWVNLYKAWEKVGDAAGGGYHAILGEGWADDSEQSRFTGTAQSRKAIGDEARHASNSGRYEPPQNPMSLDDAREFVGRVITACAKEVSTT